MKMEQLKDILQSELAIPILAFFSVIGIGASIILFRNRQNKTLESRLKAERWSEPLAGGPKEKSGILRLIEQIGNVASHGKASTTLWEQLVQAGYFNSKAPAIYTGIKMMLLMKRRNSMRIYVSRSLFRCIIMANHDLMFHAREAMTM